MIEAMKRVVAAFDAPDGMPEFCKAIDDMRQAIAEAEQQEPAAWYDKHGMVTHDPFEGVTPLYTAPPQRQPLTDEQIKLALSDMSALQMPFNKLIPAIARAIEAAHGIKEQT